MLKKERRDEHKRKKDEYADTDEKSKNDANHDCDDERRT